MKKFELFMCCLGNGITVCNKAIVENGDYKIIAHIAECGKIKWYVKPGNIPGDELLTIERRANVMRSDWVRYIDSMPLEKRYETLLDAVPVDVVLHTINLDGGIYDKIEYLKRVCYEKAYF